MKQLHNPYSKLMTSDAQWFKGNLHAHTTRSDGQHEPQALINDYKAADYDFLAVTDHDIISEPEFIDNLDTGKMTVISGNEITANGPHLCHIHCNQRIHPSWRRADILKKIQTTDPDSLVIMNHPNWQDDFDHCSSQLLLQLNPYHGLEILNAKTMQGDGEGLALNKWDICLTANKRIWGFANDDAHAPNDVGRAWNMVLAENTGPLTLINAMKTGSFYASSGVTIDHIETQGLSVTIQAQNAKRIIATGRSGKRFGFSDSGKLTIEIKPAKTNYLRFTLLGEREEKAWTQPFFLK